MLIVFRLLCSWVDRDSKPPRGECDNYNVPPILFRSCLEIKPSRGLLSNLSLRNDRIHPYSATLTHQFLDLPIDVVPTYLIHRLHKHVVLHKQAWSICHLKYLLFYFCLVAARGEMLDQRLMHFSLTRNWPSRTKPLLSQINLESSSVVVVVVVAATQVNQGLAD